MELIDVRRGVAELIRSVERRYGTSGAAEAGISTGTAPGIYGAPPRGNGGG